MSLHGPHSPHRHRSGLGFRVSAALLLAVQSGGCGAGGGQDLGPTAKVQKGRLERIVVATGTIEPISEVEVRPRIPGIITKIHVEAGDVVQGGPAARRDRARAAGVPGARGRGGAARGARRAALREDRRRAQRRARAQRRHLGTEARHGAGAATSARRRWWPAPRRRSTPSRRSSPTRPSPRRSRGACSTCRSRRAARSRPSPP